MIRRATAPVVGLLGLAAVVASKWLVWTHRDLGDFPSGVTLTTYQEATRYRAASWTHLFSTWLLSALVVAAALAVVSAFLWRSVRPLVVVACSAVAAFAAYVAQRLPGDAEIVAAPSSHRYSGVGIGAWVAVVGFLLLAASAATSSPVPGSARRVVGALALLGAGGWLVVHAIEFTGWIDTRDNDAPYPYYLWMQQAEYRFNGGTYLDQHILAVARAGPLLAVLLVLAAVAFPRARTWLSRAGMVAAVLAVVAVVNVLGDGSNRAALHGLDKLEAGLYVYSAGCAVLLAAAALLARRAPREPR